jgi:hypothetical protein
MLARSLTSLDAELPDESLKALDWLTSFLLLSLWALAPL